MKQKKRIIRMLAAVLAASVLGSWGVPARAAGPAQVIVTVDLSLIHIYTEQLAAQLSAGGGPLQPPQETILHMNASPCTPWAKAPPPG